MARDAGLLRPLTAAMPPPFRAEHIGSLLRPDALRDGFRRHRSGEIDAAAFRAVQDRCIREAVAMQEGIGLRAVTDGEFRRTTYISHFVDSVDGLDFAPSSFRFYDDDRRAHEFVAPRPTGKLRRVKSNSGAEFDFLKSVTSRTPKSTLPSPATMHFLAGADAPPAEIYPTEDEFFADLAAVYREDVADLARRGARYVQIDDVPFAMLCDSALRARLAAAGRDPDALLETYIDLTNAALAGRPSDMTAALHVCRGNLKGTWLSEGGYEAVAARLFARLDADAFFLEYDTDRAGGFAPLAAVPDGRRVVLGLVSTKTPALEDPSALAARIAEAARYVPLDRLSISPQCGFSSAVTGNPVSADDQRAKLALVVETARRVWDDA